MFYSSTRYQRGPIPLWFFSVFDFFLFVFYNLKVEKKQKLNLTQSNQVESEEKTLSLVILKQSKIVRALLLPVVLGVSGCSLNDKYLGEHINDYFTKSEEINNEAILNDIVTNFSYETSDEYRDSLYYLTISNPRFIFDNLDKFKVASYYPELLESVCMYDAWAALDYFSTDFYKDVDMPILLKLIDSNSVVVRGWIDANSSSDLAIKLTGLLKDVENGELTLLVD